MKSYEGKTLSQMTPQERRESARDLAKVFARQWGVTDSSAKAYAEANARSVQSMYSSAVKGQAL